LELPRGQEDGLRGRAEQAGLRRRGRARRVRAGDRQDQREERGATHESSGWRRENSQAIGGRVRGRAPRRQCTVIVAWPVLPSLVARKMTLPTARGWTNTCAPNPLTLMIELSLADQETARLVSKLPAASRRSARNVMPLSPSASVAVSGTTVTVATGADGPTVIVACPVLPWLVANTVAVPGARPSARSPLHDPHGYTKTNVVSELNQDAPASSTCPAESRSTASRKTPLSPAVSVALPGTMVT